MLSIKSMRSRISIIINEHDIAQWNKFVYAILANIEVESWLNSVKPFKLSCLVRVKFTSESKRPKGFNNIPKDPNTLIINWLSLWEKL